MKEMLAIKSNVVMCLSGLGLVFSLSSYPTASLAYSHQVQVNTQLEDQVSKLVVQVLKSTEDALPLVKDNSSSSLMHVQDALVAIREIESLLSPDTHVKSKSPNVVGNIKEYWFLYPRIDDVIFENILEFPTLIQKYRTGVLYQGNIISKPIDFTAYFDYAFAKASLLTAKDALTVEHTREAISSLRWVFEAVYISPNFMISQQSNSARSVELINEGDNL